MTVLITVSGHHETACAPERCTVHLAVQFDGPDAAEVWTSVTAGSTEVRRRVDAAADGIDDWFIDGIRRARRRPYDPSGGQLPYIHEATSTVRVRFSNLDAAGEFVDDIIDVDGVDIQHVDWTLTDERHAAVVTDARDRAVKDAVAKATAYARSLGLSTVTAVALADVGLLDAPIEAPRMFASRADMAGGVTLKPEDIRVTADVHGRFEAS